MAVSLVPSRMVYRGVYLQATGRTALFRLHMGACDICLPACTLCPNMEKYSDKTFISAGRCAASLLYGSIGDAKATAHSADVSSIFENMMNVERDCEVLLREAEEGKRRGDGQRGESTKQNRSR